MIIKDGKVYVMQSSCHNMDCHIDGSNCPVCGGNWEAHPVEVCAATRKHADAVEYGRTDAQKRKDVIARRKQIMSDIGDVLLSYCRDYNLAIGYTEAKLSITAGDLIGWLVRRDEEIEQSRKTTGQKIMGERTLKRENSDVMSKIVSRDISKKLETPKDNGSTK